MSRVLKVNMFSLMYLHFRLNVIYLLTHITLTQITKSSQPKHWPNNYKPIEYRFYLGILCKVRILCGPSLSVDMVKGLTECLIFKDMNLPCI